MDYNARVMALPSTGAGTAAAYSAGLGWYYIGLVLLIATLVFFGATGYQLTKRMTSEWRNNGREDT